MAEIHLILQYYLPKKLPLNKGLDLERKQEIDHCLRKNIENPLITKIHLLTEKTLDFSPFDSDKLIQTVIGEHITYQRAFEYAKESLSGKLCVLGNCDVYFDDTLSKLFTVDMTNKLFALLRWDVQTDGSSKITRVRDDMQDSWMFKAPLPYVYCDYKMGVLGCESKTALALFKAGVQIFNPCYDIRVYHYHLSQDKVRWPGYHKRISPPYHHVGPIELEDIS
jgi:hypothetical protein